MPELKSPVVEGMQESERIFSNNVEDHYPIPAICKSGCVLMRLEFTEEERQQIAAGADLYAEVLTSTGIQPMRFTVNYADSSDDWKAEGY